MNTVKIQISNVTSDFIISKATLGNSVVDIGSFDQDYYFQDVGLKHTSFCQSAICYIDGIQSILLYREYPIEKLAKAYEFPSIIYLLQHGDLPNKKALSSFVDDYKRYLNIPDYCYQALSTLPHDLHPMSILLVLVGILSGDESTLEIDDVQMSRKVIAQMPILVALAQRHSAGKQPVMPRKDLGYVENFLYMLNGEVPDDLSIEVFDSILTLHAEHEQNASTCTLRVSGSTGNNAYAALAAAVTALWGPAHGGANEACLNMLEEINHVDKIQEYIDKAKSKDDPFRLFGFGHRVYRNNDPRATVMKSLCKRVLDKKHDNPLFTLARKLEKIALEDPYFISHKLYPNVDYYSGIVQRALGIQNNCFTTVFALARVSGWMSHWLEMKASNTPIIRPRQHYIGHSVRELPKTD